MLLIDDLLAAPLRGLFFVLREINEAVAAERAADERRLMAELAELHRLVESGDISEADFEAREQQVLDRLDRKHREENSDAGRDPEG